MVWAGVEPLAPLAALHRKVDQLLARVEVPAETRAFMPHITLARLNRAAGPVAPFLAQSSDLASPDFTFTHVTLYESELAHGGARYHPVARYPLDALADVSATSAAATALTSPPSRGETAIVAIIGVGHAGSAAPRHQVEHQPQPRRRIGRRKGARFAQVRGVGGEDLVEAIKIVGRQLAGAEVRNVGAAPPRFGLGAGVGRMADMPVAGARRIEHRGDAGGGKGGAGSALGER